MPLPSPLGPISLALSGLETLLASSATFSAWSLIKGVVGDVVANHIYEVDSLPFKADGTAYSQADIIATRPCAIVNIGSTAGLRIAVNSPQSSADSGQLVIQFQDDIVAPTPADYRVSVRNFMNNVGQVIQEVLEASQNFSDTLMVTEIASAGSILRTPPTEVAGIGDCHFATFTLTWGMR